MSENANLTAADKKRVLMVVANPAVNPVVGWPVGFWASELTHPWYEFTEAGYEVEIASPEGGKVEMDGYSDPRHESGYSAGDLISMGFINTPGLAALLEDTLKLSEIDLESYDAVVVCGGQSPMFTFRENEDLKEVVRSFYESGRVTSALCHGVSGLIDVKLSDGEYLISGKTMTGFANAEEDAASEGAGMPGQRMFPWTIEDAARERDANYIEAGLWAQFAIRDGNLITGQQQRSGREVAKLVIEALGV